MGQREIRNGEKSAESLKREAEKRKIRIEEKKGEPFKTGDDRFEDFQDRAEEDD